MSMCRVVPLIVVLIVGCGQPRPVEHAECAPCPSCSEASAEVEEAPEPEAGEETEEESGPVVSVGECDVAWLPAGLVSDVDAAATEQLVELVRGWIAETDRPALEVARGVAHAKSEDDTGADPPYPSFVGRSAALACGSNAVWLRQHVRSLVALHASPEYGEGIRCARNVCCYAAAGEYDSSGTMVFTRVPDDRWALRAVAIVADNGTLGEEWVSDERAWVVRQLTTHARGRCAGEPASLVW